MSRKVYVGIDLGGTSIKVGLCDEKGSLLHTYEGPTETERSTEGVIDNTIKYIEALIKESAYTWNEITGIGAGVAGFLDVSQGIIEHAPNIGFRNVPIKQILSDRLHRPVFINNDANVAALGEGWSGAGQHVANFVCYTLGTGVGGGLVAQNRLIEGFMGMAGELGHMSIVPDLEAEQCGCGQSGCLETVSSATAIMRMANDAITRGDRTSLQSLTLPATAKDVFEAAKAGDELSVRVIHRAAYYLGRSMSLVAAVLNPELFIIGGGVSKAGDFLFDQVRETFLKYTPKPLQKEVEIVPAALGNEAGMIGAAYLCKTELSIKG